MQPKNEYETTLALLHSCTGAAKEYMESSEGRPATRASAASKKCRCASFNGEEAAEGDEDDGEAGGAADMARILSRSVSSSVASIEPLTPEARTASMTAGDSGSADEAE